MSEEVATTYGQPQATEQFVPGGVRSPINYLKESTMEHDVNDKVDVHNIFKPGHGGGDGGMGGLGTAAVIAAMGNRNETGGLAAMLPALMGRPHHDGGFGMGGFGAGLVGGLLGGALFGGGRRGGIFGGGGDCDNNGAETRIGDQAASLAILSKLGNIEAGIPLAAANTESVILQQTNQINTLASAAQLANSNGFAGTKDVVQNLGLLLSQAICGINQNVSAQGCSTREAVQNDGDKTRALLVARFSQEDATAITSLNAELVELRNENRSRANHDELRLQITNNNTAVAAQAQGQQQQQQQQQFQLLAALVPTVHALIGDIQAVKQGQVIFNSGTMAASGTQAAANTKVA